MIDYVLIGKRIKEARKAKKLTQEAMAEIMDISLNYYSNIERAESQANLTRLSEISGILDVSLEHLICGADKPAPVYLYKDLAAILSKCTPEQKEAIYKTAKAISQL